MEIHVRRLLYSKHSNIFLSIILGFGLATIFRKVCKKRNCITFRAPPMDEISGKTFKFNNKCYKFKEHIVNCDKSKKMVAFA